MKTKFFTLLLNKSLLSKLALIALLLTGGGNCAWGDTVVVQGNSIKSPWETTSASITGTYPGPSSATSVFAFSTDNPDYIYVGGNYSWYYLHTTLGIELTKGQKIIINVRSANGVSTGSYVGTPEVKIRYSTNNSTWSVLNEFTSADINTTGTFSDIQTDEIDADGTYYFQIFGKGVYIASIIIKDAEAASTPILKLTPDNATVFGNVISNASNTYNIKNTGLGIINVAFSFEDDAADGFSITDEAGNVITELTGIENDEVGKNFKVIFNFDEESLGNHSTTINISASSAGEFVDWTATKTISASATAKDPNLWEEDFSSGIPSTWINENSKWTVPSTGSYIGTASSGYNSGDPALITPRLQATEGNNTLQFDEKVASSGNSYYLRVSYSTDLINWTDINTYSYSSSFTTKSWEAPTAGYYWVRFQGYNAYIDNLIGLRLAPAMNEIALASSSIPEDVTQFKEFTASVTVKEIGGLDEDVTAELYIDGKKVATTAENIVANTTATIELSYIPTETLTDVKAYIKVLYNSDSSFKQTEEVDFSVVAPALTLDEDNAASWNTTDTYSTVLVKYIPANGWNTLCLPFTSTSYMNDIFGSGWKAYSLSNYSNGVLTFTSSSYVFATSPYLVYIEEAASHEYGVVLESIKMSRTDAPSATVFRGTYVTKEYQAGDNWYGVTTAGQVMKAGTGAKVKGYRAYFTGISAPAAGAHISIAIDDDGGTTDLGFVKLIDENANDVYTLSGQKVKKGGKGIYIVNGRKVIIK